MAKRSRADVKRAIDLLWSHQIRRENAALHKELQSLREGHSKSIGEIEKLRAISEKTLTAQENANILIEQLGVEQTRLESKLQSLSEERDVIRAKVQSLEGVIQQQQKDHRQAMAEVQKETTALKNDFTYLRQQSDQALEEAARDASSADTEVNQLREDTDFRLDQFSTIINQILIKIEGSNNQVPATSHEKLIRSAESRLSNQIRASSVSRVEESIDQQQSHHISTGAASINSPQLVGGTLRGNEGSTDIAEIEVEDLDLDENVQTMNYFVNNRGNAPLTDTLMTLPQLDMQTQLIADPSTLKQARFHTWDRYFAKANEMMKKIPKKREFELLSCFLNGLYSKKQRQECEKWLDVSGWTWSHLASFGIIGTPAGPAQFHNSVEDRSSNQPIKVPEKGVKGQHEEKRVSEPGERPQIQNQYNPETKVAEQDPPRRSQRLLEQHPQISHESLDRPRSASCFQKRSKATKSNLGDFQQRSRLKRKNKSKETVDGHPNDRPRDAKGRFQAVEDSNSTAHSRVANDVIQTQSNHQAGGGVPVGRSGTAPEVNPDKVFRSVEHRTANDGQPVESGYYSNITSRKKVAKKIKLPKTPRKQDSAVRVRRQQHLSTPPSQISIEPNRDPTPRLVKRKRSPHQHSKGPRKKPRLLDDGGLPPVPQQGHRKVSRGQKKKRLPLPPPPQIPIMPTSD